MRSRRESLWEEAEIDGLDLRERTDQWGIDSIQQGWAPQSARSRRDSFRRGSAMSVLHHLLGQDQSTEGVESGLENGGVLESPRDVAPPAGTTVSISREAGAVGTEVTLRSPKSRQLQDSCTYLKPPPIGPR